MRIHLDLSPNARPVPFNYQQSLVGAFHKWMGINKFHDDTSLYSLSWLSPGVCTEEGLDFPKGSTFFISSPLEELHSKMLVGIFKHQWIRWGMKVRDIRIEKTPDFGTRRRFLAQSPVLIKRSLEGQRHQQYYYPGDPLADQYLTETLQVKLQKAKLSTEVSVRFDSDYQRIGIRKIKYNNIEIKAALCPVIVEGNARAVRFAWEVGIGNSTGIGFGALR